MEDVLLTIASFAVHVSPALVASIWATFSTVPHVKSLMTLTAKLFVFVVISLFSFAYAAEISCEGSALKGFVRCSLIPINIAGLVIPIYLLSVGVLVAWFLLATALCIRAEFAALKEANEGH
ncbi:hypothetical protein [Salipiger bermudensis]|uniref:hypothetical protein n=1 Tax=Salipiger bermudensis TaxID=344736 RepID=UPI001CD627EC|nr:hypothetical protein [Salipiger bermudensis]MCA1288381.1 hypothetical protein [Salipiger bermudensis]